MSEGITRLRVPDFCGNCGTRLHTSRELGRGHSVDDATAPSAVVAALRQERDELKMAVRKRDARIVDLERRRDEQDAKLNSTIDERDEARNENQRLRARLAELQGDDDD